MSTHVALHAPQKHTDQSVLSASSGVAILAYGVGAYAIGVAALLALIVATLGLVPLGTGLATLGSPLPRVGLTIGALLNATLLVGFAAQHSVMARPWFKARWTRVVHPSMERSSYVLATGVFLLPLLALWQPVGGMVWAIESPLLRVGLTSAALLGWAYLFAASFAINHFELFGLQQVWRHFRGLPPTSAPFRERWMYRFDRHPIMTGLLLGLWATPDMSGAHLMLAVGMTLYVMVGVHFEERALRRQWGEQYEAYRRRVPTLVPLPFAAR